MVTNRNAKRPVIAPRWRTLTLSGRGSGGKEAGAQAEHLAQDDRDGGDEMADAIGQAERINALAAVEHDVGQAGAAEEHADDRLDSRLAPRKRDQFARHEMGYEIGVGDFEQPLQGLDRIAVGAEIERDEIGLAAGKHGDRRSGIAEVAAIIDFGQRRLNRPVAAVDCQDRGADPGDGPHCLADLVGALDLIMEDVGVRIAKGTDPPRLE